MKMNTRREMASKARAKFSERLTAALRNAAYDTGPTTLQRLFNAYYKGPPVTVHACRKWLIGESIPTHDKLEALARMCGVAVEWLAFGDRATNAERGNGDALSPEDARVVAELKAMDEPHRTIARSIVALIAKMK